MAFAASVGEAILLRFQAYAERAVDQGADAEDPAYEKLLEGLQAAAAPAGPLVMAKLLDWRADMLTDLDQRNDAVAQRKRLTIEALFLEATGRLAGASPGALSGGQGADLEAVAFDWLLGADQYLSYPDPYRHKDRVVLAAARMLGALSPLRLASITQRWVSELAKLLRADSNSPARQQLYDLCHGMRFVRLAAGSDAQLEASVEFLRVAHPLTHVAPDKKSRVQQAVCDMLAGALAPLADAGEPGDFGAGCDAALRQRFAQQVTVLRTDLLKWASKQSKQVASGYPAVAVLLCLESREQLVASVDGFIDSLHKLLRDRRTASVALLCLARVTACFLRRMGARSDPARMAKWLSRGAAPVVQACVKGGLPAAEQQELVRQLCAGVAAHLPEFALSGMVLELLQAVDLQAGTNWEAPMAGLMALLTILAAAPGKLEGRQIELELHATAAGLERAGVGVWVPPAEAVRQLLDLVKRGINPLDAFGVGRLRPRLEAALGRLVAACHQLYGFSRVTSMLKTSDAAARERLGALPVFVMALQCVPFVMPEHWANGAICEDLPGYTIHAEPSMRQVSTTVLRRCMRTLPPLRNRLLAAFAAFVARIQEEFPEVTKGSLALLLSLLREWSALAVSEWPPAGAGEAPPAPLAAFDSLHRVEGSALVLLCSADVEVRRMGVELLRTARDLHRTLSSPPKPSSKRATMVHGAGAGAGALAGSRRATGGGGAPGEGPPPSPDAAPAHVYVADLVESSGAAIVARAYWDFGRCSDLWRAWRPVPEGATLEECMGRTRTQEDATRWARLLCELLRECWVRCERSAWVAHLEVIAKLQGLLSLDSSGRQVLPADAKLELSRTYCLALAAAPPLDASRLGERSLTSRELVRLLVATLRGGGEAAQGAAVLALGCMHPGCHATVLLESASLADDYLDRQLQRSALSMPNVPGMGRRAPRKDDVRLAHAHLTRMVADAAPPGSLADNAAVRDKLVEFVRETARHITTTADVSPELQQLRYCLAAVARQCGGQLGAALPQAFPAQTRRALYDMLSLYCEEAQQPGQFRNDLRRIITQARQRVKDADAGRNVEADIVDSTEVLERGAYLAMAAMLAGPLFSGEVANPQGRVFAWADRMLSAAPAGARLADWGPPKDVVGRAALTNLLQYNAELAPVFVDRSYSANQRVAAGYFQVLHEVCARRPLPLPQYVGVSLVLHKVADPRRAVRDAARGLLATLARHAWGRGLRHSEQHEGPAGAPAVPAGGGVGDGGDGGDDGGGAVVVGALANSYAAYQLRLSARLAREHQELSDAVANEVLGRQLLHAGGPDALLSLCPWLERVTIPTQWEGHWSQTLLDSLYRITGQQRDRLAHERLWATLAANRLSIVPALNFLIDRGLREEGGEGEGGGGDDVPAATGKEIVVYLSRVAARQVVGHLVHEALQLIEQPDAPEDGGGGDGGGASGTPDGTPRILEYHHRRTDSSLLHPQLPALHRLSASTAPPPGGGPGSGAGSRPGTPGGSARGGAGLGRRATMFEQLMRSQSLWSADGGGGAAEGAPGAAPGAGAAPAPDGRLSALAAKSLSLSDGRSSFDSRQTSMSRGGGQAAAAGERRPPPTRPEVALSLLAEVAYEQDEEFRRHLPQLLHVCLVSADSGSPAARRDSQQLLVYLLHSLSLKHLEAAQAPGAPSAEREAVAGVVSGLQRALGQQLWPREHPSLARPVVPSAAAVAVFVQTVTECFVFDRELRDRWCAESLRWACGAASRHAASRSHQAFCALRPVLGAQSASAMLAALHKCLAPGRASGSDAGALDAAVEVLCSLRALLAGLLAQPGKALLYPQLLLACVALLQSSVVRLVELAMHLLLQLLAVVDLNDPVAQNTMLAMLPLPEDPEAAAGGRSPGELLRGGSEAAEAAAAAAAGGLDAAAWPMGQGLLGGSAEPEVEEALGPWLALPQLAVKALFQPETELLALELLGAIADQVAGSDAAAQRANNAAGAGAGGGADLRSCLSLADGLLLAPAGGGPAGVEAVLGDLRAGQAIALGAALPWLCVHLRRVGSEGVVGGFLESSGGAADALGWPGLAAALRALAGMAGGAEEPAQWLPPLCAALCGALFPTYGRLLLQRLQEAAQRGAECYQRAALAAMRCVFEVPGLDLGPSGWPAGDAGFAAALSAALAGPLSADALGTLRAMLAVQGATGRRRGADAAADGSLSDGEQEGAAGEASGGESGGEGGGAPQLSWPRCMDDLGASNRLCSEALERVIWACPGSAQLLWGHGGAGSVGGGGRAVAHASRDSFLPFLR